MRIRLKLKIEEKIKEIINEINIFDDLFTSNHQKIQIANHQTKYYDSFASIIDSPELKFLKDEENDFLNLKRITKQMDSKSKKILFPVDLSKTITIHDLKNNIKKFLNENYYDLLIMLNKFLIDYNTNIEIFGNKANNINSENKNENHQKIFLHFKIIVSDLTQNNYALYDDFRIKDIIKENDKIEYLSYKFLIYYVLIIFLLN